VWGDLTEETQCLLQGFLLLLHEHPTVIFTKHVAGKNTNRQEVDSQISKSVKWWNVATLLWPSVGVKPNTWKKLGLESSGTPESSEDDLEDQNTSHWGVLGVIGKVLKRRYRKCPRILNLDICSPSYGKKNGRESNWQFDSRPLKVGNRPASDVRFGSAIRRWKDLDEGYNFGSDLVVIRGRGEELCSLKVPRVQNRDTWVDFGTPTWESWEFVPFGCGCGGASQSIL
jgi:hypothetical protein